MIANLRCRHGIRSAGLQFGKQRVGRIDLGELSLKPTNRGIEGYRQNTHDFNKLIWREASPTWKFDDATYDRTAAAFANPDHVDIVIHNYRWRLGLAQGEPQYDDLDRKLAASPPITVPAITIGSDFDGPNKDGAAYRKMFTGPYSHRILDGIGHNVPQEAPQAFADAVVAAENQ